jgi:hypothetical protein
VLLHRIRRQLFCDHVVDQPDRPRYLNGRWPWWSFVLALSTCLAVLVPLAYASPADSLWIAGIYDAADNNDVVVAATSLESLAQDEPLAVSPVSTVVDSVVPVP